MNRDIKNILENEKRRITSIWHGYAKNIDHIHDLLDRWESLSDSQKPQQLNEDGKHVAASKEQYHSHLDYYRSKSNEYFNEILEIDKLLETLNTGVGCICNHIESEEKE